MTNDYLEFYGQNNISPVRQDISDYSKHCLRRRNLYRQLGISLLSLRGANVLEIGAGGGFNTLPLFDMGGGVQHVDIVEPNKKGREDIECLFKSHNITPDRYKIFDSLIEDFQINKKYDFIIAEGFIQHLDNAEEILYILEKYTHPNSVIIITCSNEIGFYIEKMKRLVGNYIIKDIDNYADKVNTLVNIYEKHLSNLKGMSRLATDWV